MHTIDVKDSNVRSYRGCPENLVNLNLEGNQINYLKDLPVLEEGGEINLKDNPISDITRLEDLKDDLKKLGVKLKIDTPDLEMAI